jgi:hypothetical protein
LLSLAGITAIFCQFCASWLSSSTCWWKVVSKKNYFDALRDLEIMMRSHHVRNKKVEKIIEDLRKSTLRQENFLFVFYTVTDWVWLRLRRRY